MVESIAAGQVGDNKHIEMWKVKRLIKQLDNCKGNGTSMVSLIIPPKDDINKYSKLLVGELSAAQNIKSRVTKQSVTTAITSTKESKFSCISLKNGYLFTFRAEALQTDSYQRSMYLLRSHPHGRRKD